MSASWGKKKITVMSRAWDCGVGGGGVNKWGMAAQLSPCAKGQCFISEEKGGCWSQPNLGVNPGSVPVLSVWSRASQLASLSLSFLVRIREGEITSWDCWKIKLDDSYKVLRLHMLSINKGYLID